jgi:hypothetical protein
MPFSTNFYYSILTRTSLDTFHWMTNRTVFLKDENKYFEIHFVLNIATSLKYWRKIFIALSCKLLQLSFSDRPCISDKSQFWMFRHKILASAAFLIFCFASLLNLFQSTYLSSFGIFNKIPTSTNFLLPFDSNTILFSAVLNEFRWLEPKLFFYHAVHVFKQSWWQNQHSYVIIMPLDFLNLSSVKMQVVYVQREITRNVHDVMEHVWKMARLCDNFCPQSVV